MALLEIEYHPSPGILTIDHALAMSSYHETPRICERGNIAPALKSGYGKKSGSFLIPPQQASLIGPTELTVTPVNSGQGYSVRTRALSPYACPDGGGPCCGHP